jgi:hypothetical protein
MRFGLRELVENSLKIEFLANFQLREVPVPQGQVEFRAGNA